MLFLGIIHESVLHVSIGGFAFQMGGFIFKWGGGGTPLGGIGFDGGRFSKKIVGGGGGVPPMPPTMGNPELHESFLEHMGYLWFMKNLRKCCFWFGTSKTIHNLQSQIS